MHARPIQQLSEWLQNVEGRIQQRRVVTVGRGDDAPKWDVSRGVAIVVTYRSVHRVVVCA
jgi:hypothetical protein